MSVPMLILMAVAIVAVAGNIALGVLLVVPLRRRRPGVAPFAIRTAWQTADSLMKKGIGATRCSIRRITVNLPTDP